MDGKGADENAKESQGSECHYIANPLMGDDNSDWSPLHEASVNGRLLTLKTLISQGTCVNILTANEVSPLHEACLGGHPACASVLIKNGAKVNGSTINWCTPLFNACVSGSVDCVKLLLQHGANPHGVCDLASPIHEAAKRGHTDCVKTLVSNGVSIDHNIKHLGTPLYVACKNQQVDCAKELLESGASANFGKGLKSPLHKAAECSNTVLVNLLIDFGADTKAQNAEGKKPAELVPPDSKLAETLLQKEGAR